MNLYNKSDSSNQAVLTSATTIAFLGALYAFFGTESKGSSIDKILSLLSGFTQEKMDHELKLKSLAATQSYWESGISLIKPIVENGSKFGFGILGKKFGIN